ncbi:hypothetical protein MSG28_004115 [Choristoneura fumiferana]|uniref:Uncharacterized protein n=1 Tax=Choristoneura fumiferana TaxID=7141 RepID=A0ACC0KHI0_CHOFU|nr:hypothetical protein MSG28_004115 [Choristoneura fumiferana]
MCNCGINTNEIDSIKQGLPSIVNVPREGKGNMSRWVTRQERSRATSTTKIAKPVTSATYTHLQLGPAASQAVGQQEEPLEAVRHLQLERVHSSFKSNEGWIQCQKCKKWAHYHCADIDTKIKTLV